MARSVNGLRGAPGSHERRSLLAGFAAVAASLALALGGGYLLLRGGSGPSPTAGPTATPSTLVAAASPSPSAGPSRSADTSASPSIAPVEAALPQRFTTPGSLSAWTNLRPTTLPVPNLQFARLVKWSGGYALSGALDGADESGVYFSPDGETWDLATRLPGAFVQLTEMPGGLVAIADAAAVWTSTDGRAWSDRGRLSGLGDVPMRIEGTDRSLVAEYLEPNAECGSFASSRDGVRWTPLSVERGVAWEPGIDGATCAELFAASGRLFISAGIRLSGRVVPVLWWSDDGRSWTRAAGITSFVSYVGAAAGMNVFAATVTRPGLMVSGGGYERSIDGGRSWHVLRDFDPLPICRDAGCGVQPDGWLTTGADGSLAFSYDRRAWTSKDLRAWTPITWAGGIWPATSGGMLVLPRGILIDGEYAAAE